VSASLIAAAIQDIYLLSDSSHCIDDPTQIISTGASGSVNLEIGEASGFDVTARANVVLHPSKIKAPQSNNE
jgi:hypothetical protein